MSTPVGRSGQPVDVNAMIQQARTDGTVDRHEAASIIENATAQGVSQREVESALLQAGVARADVRAARSEAHSQVRQDQHTLLALGYDVGRQGADGVAGEATAAAVRQFQQDHGVEPVTGVLDADTRAVMGDEISSNQHILASLGYNLGSTGISGVDGRVGPRTKAATRQFQQHWNREHPNQRIPTTGHLDFATRSALLDAWQPVSNQQEQTATWARAEITSQQHEVHNLRAEMPGAFREMSIDRLQDLRGRIGDDGIARMGINPRTLDTLERKERLIGSLQRGLATAERGDVAGYARLEAMRSITEAFQSLNAPTGSQTPPTAS